MVAGTKEIADQGVSLVRMDYQAEHPALAFEALLPQAQMPKNILGQPSLVQIGDAEAALKDAAIRVDAVYRTPRYYHNAIELHASTAQWDGDDSFVVHDSSQVLGVERTTLATMFGLEQKKVRVLAPFVGGGFGGKTLWNHTILCIAAAKLVKRPVRLVLSREDVFRVTGGRTLSEQRVALGAKNDGTLTALIHTGTTAVVSHNSFPEQLTFPARHLYASNTMLLQQKIVGLDMVFNTAIH